MVKGSPPPMRGKGKPWALFFRVHRITPAYAGKSSLTLSHKLIQKDHPRLCGEKFLKETFYNGNKGSPPPMRGKDFASSVRNAASGITPAYAGKSSLIKCFVGVWKDHPRLCGEKPMALHRFQMDIGSPPPMRGKAFS